MADPEVRKEERRTSVIHCGWCCPKHLLDYLRELREFRNSEMSAAVRMEQNKQMKNIVADK